MTALTLAEPPEIHEMEFFTVTLIAFGLAMDALAVAIVSGATCKELRMRHAFGIAALFGGFQAIMPLTGVLAGLTIKDYIADYDHWVAFGLLSAVGAKMIYESFEIKHGCRKFDPLNFYVLLMLSVATSIDALAVGVTLSLLAVGIFTAAAIIGLVTFALSYLGVYIGKRFGHVFESKIEILGGVILIAIGVKILLSDLLR